MTSALAHPWLTYKKQQPMLDARAEYRDENLVPFAVQDHQTGTYSYVLTTYAELFYRMTAGRVYPLGARHLFELILDVSPEKHTRFVYEQP